MAVDIGGVTQITDLKPTGYPARFSGAPHGRRLRDLKVGLRRGEKCLSSARLWGRALDSTAFALHTEPSAFGRRALGPPANARIR